MNIKRSDYTSKTLGGEKKAIRFSYSIEEREISFISESPQEIPSLKIDAIPIIVAEFQKRHKNEEEWIKLANRVDALAKSNGLGGILYSLPENNRNGNINRFAQCASYYGAMLCEIGILQWNGKNSGIAFRLNPEFMNEKYESKIKKHLKDQKK